MSNFVIIAFQIFYGFGSQKFTHPSSSFSVSSLQDIYDNVVLDFDAKDLYNHLASEFVESSVNIAGIVNSIFQFDVLVSKQGLHRPIEMNRILELVKIKRPEGKNVLAIKRFKK